MAPDADQHRLPPAQLLEIFERHIAPRLFAGLQSERPPRAIVFGGQPGAGKSAAMDTALGELGGVSAAASIVGDELRGFHPMYTQLLSQNDQTAAFYTDRDSGAWVEMAIRRGIQLGANMAIEGTMRNADKVAETLQLLREGGYRTEARALAVPREQSWLGVLTRYEEQRQDRGRGRMTAVEAHQAGYDGLPVTLERIERERLADKVSVYRRGGLCLYWHQMDSNLKSDPGKAATQMLAEFRELPPSLAEQRQIVADYERLQALMRRPERAASPHELANVDQLHSGAKRRLMAEVFRTQPEAKAVAEFPALAESYRLLARTLAAQPSNDPQAVRVVKEAFASAIAQGITPGYAVIKGSGLTRSQGRFR